MKKLLAAIAVAAFAVSAASAADLGTRKPLAPVVPIMTAYNWTGFYLGIQGGYGFGDGIQHRQGGASSGRFNYTGGLVGATIGYNQQFGNLVAGVEADYAWAKVTGSTAVGCAVPGCRTELRSFGTVRGRIGYAFDRFMPYITGGLAVADIYGRAAGFTGSDLRAGWTIGAGLEAAIWRNVSLKGEYLYYDFGRNTYNSVAVPSISTNAKGHILRAGLNYRF
ncbi:MAG TPA: porin family protein [Rhabdaerophilum sp.]|nr:porin family protein [Rhabdaerophilum sp.]